MEQAVKIGKLGEDLAVAYLLRLGFRILFRNWRFRHWEIDIIATKNNILHIVEVKTRTSLLFGYPEQNITNQKMQYLMNAATEFLYQFPEWKRIQFDALSILLENDSATYFFIEDIYL